MPEWKAIGCKREIYRRFERERPDDMTQTEYLEHLMAAENGEVEEIADVVAEKIERKFGIERQKIRQSARSGTLQALREME